MPLTRQQSVFSILALIIIAALVGYFYFFRQPNPSTRTPNTSNYSDTQNATTTPSQALKNGVYIGRGSGGKYSLVNIANGDKKQYIPEGTTIVDQHAYDVFPLHLILQKGVDLLSFDLERGTTQQIFSKKEDKLQPNEEIRLYPSITEKGRLMIAINRLDSKTEEEAGLPKILATRTYVFDAAASTIEKVANATFDDCHKYDSKNKRFFSWPCGEGIGSSIPLSIRDLTGKLVRDIVPFSEYGLKKDDLAPVAVEYNSGRFYILEKDNLTKITVVDPNPAEPAKEVYTVSPAVKAKLKDQDTYPYSIVMNAKAKTFVMGGGHALVLLRFNGSNQFTESKVIQDKELYANFLFPYNGKVVYQAKDGLKMIDLATWNVENTLPGQREEEITLVKIK